MKKGDTGESDYSREFHEQHTPFLISSTLLRSMNLGQIDIAYLKRKPSQLKKSWVLHLIEVKSSHYPSPFQYKRLLGTQEYLGKVLEIESKLEVKFCQKANDSLCF
jgi:hypothetical protein